MFSLQNVLLKEIPILRRFDGFFLVQFREIGGGFLRPILHKQVNSVGSQYVPCLLHFQ